MFECNRNYIFNAPLHFLQHFFICLCMCTHMCVHTYVCACARVGIYLPTPLYELDVTQGLYSKQSLTSLNSKFFLLLDRLSYQG